MTAVNDELAAGQLRELGMTCAHRAGNTIAYDDEGFAVFTLPGEHGACVVLAVERIRSTASATGQRYGREALGADLRRLIGAGGA